MPPLPDAMIRGERAETVPAAPMLNREGSIEILAEDRGVYVPSDQSVVFHGFSAINARSRKGLKDSIPCIHLPYKACWGLHC
jgi:hypothetical protein